MKQNKKPACKTEKTFEYIFENIIDGIILADSESKKFSMCNRAICHMLGYSKKELLNIDIHDIHPKEALPHIDKLFNQLLNNEIELAKDIPTLKKDGTIFYADIAASPIQYNGKPHLAATFRNITERKRSEEALQESERKYRRIVDTANEGIIAVDENHIITFVNNRMTDMLGYQPEEMIGLLYSSFLFNEDIPDYEARIIQRRKGVPSHYERRIRHKDGNPIWTIISTTPLLDSQHRFIGSIAMFTDITERKHAEEAHKGSEAILKSLFDAIPVGIGLMKNRVNIKVNNSLCKISGYSEKELLEQDSRLFYTDEDEYNRVGKELIAQIKKEGFGVIETRNKRKDGEIIDVLLYLSPFDIKDISAGQVITVLDITGRKKMEAEKSRLEEMLLHSQKIESIGRLAGGIAHDFNNMLTAILGYTEMTMNLLDPAGKPYSQLSVVIKAAQGAANLTKQLLAFSRKQVIEPKFINLNNSIERIQKMIATLIGENIKLHIVPHNELLTIKADPGQIEQIIINLAANARDAMPDGGKLVIETSNVYLDEKYSQTHANVLPGDYAMMAVTDTGSGMSKETLDLAFEPFFTTKETGRGTGLGLATVYGIVKQNGGTIEIYSEIGQGTVFKVYFPRFIQTVKERQKSQTKIEMPTGVETILIAEDKAQVLNFSREILIHLGYKVLAAASGEEALAIAENYKENIHLFLTDIILTGINGRVTAERLLDMRPKLKILYNSGYTAEVIDKHGILEQGFNFIGKPFTSQELAIKVREVLDK
jgi:two-component system, cell cycle sensor histidine kinase and response regulator CckA